MLSPHPSRAHEQRQLLFTGSNELCGLPFNEIS
jgi:hypothetical protein